MMFQARSHRALRRFSRRVLCGVLSSVLLFQPILQAGAQGVVPDGNAGAQAPGVVAAPNGVPVVNITSPGTSGLSHNKYSDFNVGTQGLILNNSPNAGKSELGGIVLGNPNFTDRRSATIILNEITSSNRSRLEGFTEVYGRSADVIVSNPNGITCSGCGFINTPRATLSTGVPVIGADGTLNGLDVNNGDVLITGGGADASRIDAFDIVSRRVTIEAPVSAKKEINIIAGRNQVDYATRAATAKADDGSAKPTVAIDSRALGGMYSGKIALVSTEKGVGVNMASDMASHADQLTLTADGKIVMSGRTSSAGDTKITSQSSDVVVEKQLGATGKVAVTAAKGKVTVQKGVTVAGDKGVAITAKDIANAGTTQSQSTVALSAAQKIDNTGTTIASDRVDVTGTTVTNSSIIQSNGLLYIKGHTSVDNSGAMVALGAFGLSAPSLKNSGTIQTDAGFSLTGNTLANTVTGRLQARQGLSFALSDLFENTGLVETAGSFSLSAAGIDNAASGILRANGILDLRSSGTFNNKGTLSGFGGLAITATDTVGNSGDLLSGGTLSVSGTGLTNSGRLLADGTVSLTGTTLSNTAAGTIQSQGVMSVLLSAAFSNVGLFETMGNLTLSSATLDNAASGILRANKVLDLKTTSGAVTNAGLASGGTGLSLLSAKAVNNSGSLLSGGALSVSGKALTNSGRLVADGTMNLNGNALTNAATGKIQSQDALSAHLAGAFVNTGLFETAGDLVLAAPSIDNQGGGILRASGTLDLQATSTTFANAGTLSGATGVIVKSSKDLTNSGAILSGGNLRLEGKPFDNSGTILADGRLFLDSKKTANSGRIQTLGGIEATLGALTNTGLIETQGDLQLSTVSVINRKDASIRAGDGGAITATSDIKNVGLLFGGSAPLLLRAAGAIDNTGSILTEDDLRIEAASFSNALNKGDGGLVMALNDLEFAVAGTLFNDEGLLMAGGDLTIGGLNGGWTSYLLNSSGLIEAGRDVIIRAGTIENKRKVVEITSYKTADTVYTPTWNEKKKKGSFGSVKDRLVTYWYNNVYNPVTGNYEYHTGYTTGKGNKGTASRKLRIYEVFKILGAKTTAAAEISAGRDLIIQAGSVQNSMSRLMAGRDIFITASTVENSGVALYHEAWGRGDYHRSPAPCRVINDPNQSCASIPNNNPTLIASVELETGKAFIVAGRNVGINAATSFVNSVERSFSASTGKEHIGLTTVYGQTAAERQVTASAAGAEYVSHTDAATGRVSYIGAASGVSLPGVPAGFLNQPALFRPAGPSSPYLYESRKEFASFGYFYGSDYFLKAINFNPDIQLKRLGDSYFDTRLIREQVLAQAGMRWLDDSAQTDDEQMKRLLDNAVEAAGKLGLSVGAALTPAQQKALTKDIVWYVTERIDGQDVLVPRLYLSEATLARTGSASGVAGGGDVSIISGQILNNDSLKSGGSLYLEGTRSLANLGGSISAGNDLTMVSLGAIENMVQLASFAGNKGSGSYVTSLASISSGGDMTISAGGDLIARGGTFSSGSDAMLSAAGSVTLDAARTDNRYADSGKGWTARNSQVEHVGSSVGAEGDLIIAAGKNLVINGSGVFAGGDATLSGKEGVSIGTVVDESHRYDKTTSKGFMSSSMDSYQSDRTAEIGSIIAAGNDLNIVSGGDIGIRAGTLHAGNDLLIAAGAGADGRKDASVTIEAGQNTSFSEEKHKSSGFSFSGLNMATGSFSAGYSSSKSTSGQSGTETVGSRISAGNDVTILAAQDIKIAGSQVLAGNDALLSAGRDVNITTAEESSKGWHDSKTSGFGVTVGSKIFAGTTSAKDSMRQDGTYSVGSEISAGNDLTIDAGRNAMISGSWLSADRDMTISGQQVAIIAADNLQTTRESHKQSQAGITFGLKGALGDAITTAYDSTVRANQVEDSRLKGALAGQAAYNAYKATSESGLKVSVSVGGSTSKSERETSENWATASTLEAGRDVSVIARGGDGVAGNLSIIGTDITAGRDVTLAAKDNILIAAAEQNSKVDGKNSSSGGSIGMSFGVSGSSTGWTIDVAANAGKGKENGSGTTWRESTISAGDTLTVISGGDTTIRGGQLSGETVLASIGGNLSIESLQDNNNYHSKQTDVGASASVGLGGGNGSASFNQQKIDHTFTSVTEQSGIYAGSGGFDIYVGGNTDLVGAVIASTTDADKNRLDTGTLTWSDLENRSETSASGVGLSAGVGWGGQSTTGKPEWDATPFATVGLGDSDKGTTHAAVSGGTIVIRDNDAQTQDLADLSRDTDTANAGALKDDFDKKKLEEQMELQKVLTSLSTQMTRDYATSRLEEAKSDLQKGKITQAEYDEINNTYGTGGSFPRAMQAITAALQGAAGGDMSAALGGAMAPYLAGLVKDATGDNIAANVIGHALVGAIVARLQGHDAAAGAAGGAVSAATAALIAQELFGTSDPSKLTNEQKKTIAALESMAGAVAGGLAGDSTLSAAVGSLAAKNEAENNYLNPEKIDEKWDSDKYGDALDQEDFKKLRELTAKYTDISREQKRKIFDECKSGGSSGCIASFDEMLGDYYDLYNARDSLLDSDDAAGNHALQRIIEDYDASIKMIENDLHNFYSMYEGIVDKKDIPESHQKILDEYHKSNGVDGLYLILSSLGGKAPNLPPNIPSKIDTTKFKTPKPGISGKEGAKDAPSWALGERPYVGESGKDFAKRLLDAKYGPGNYKTGPASDFNKIKKWGDRSFMDP